MNKKKVLFLSHDGSVTGAPVFLRNMIRQINQSNPNYIISILFARKGTVADQLTNDGFNVYVYDKSGPHCKSLFYKLLYRLKYYYLFTKTVYGYKPDLIYSNTIMNFGEVFIARLLGFKIILHVHEGYDFAKNFKYKLKISCFCVGSIIVGSHYANQSLRKLTGFVGKVIHNGIELGINKSNISNEVSQLKLGILGTINPNKGQIVALKAVKELIKNGNKVHLSLAGQSCDEIYFNQITEYINKNDLNSYVDLLGFVSDSSCFLKGLDLLIVPSYDEVFPTVVLEALSIGLPVIASNAGGIPEIIDDKKNSYLFEVGNFIELVKIIHNISINKAQLEPVSKNAIETIESSFSVNSMVSKINLNIEACLYG